MKTQTAYVYDQVFLKHNNAEHPENADRLSAIINKLKLSGLDKKLNLVKSRSAHAEELEAVHHIEYIKEVIEISKQPAAYLEDRIYPG